MTQRNPSLVLTAAVAAAISTLANADTLQLKDGTLLEGKVIRETPESVDFEYNISKSIKDIKTISKADIESIDVEQPDEVALKEIKALLPTDDLLSATDYKDILDGKPAEFAERFKESKFTPEVKAVTDKLLEELAQVEAGGVKIDGTWITGEQAAKDPYNHQARVAAAEMKADLEERDYGEALSDFERLEKNYGFSRAFIAAIPKALDILPNYDASLAGLELSHDAMMKQREANLKTMEPSDRKRTEQAFEDKLATFKARRAAEADKDMDWLPVSKWDIDSIRDARKLITTETARLERLDLSKIGTASALLAQAIKAHAERDFETAEKQINAAAAAGARGEEIDKWKGNIRSAKVAAEEAARAAAATASTQIPGEQPGDGTTPPDGETPDGTPSDTGEMPPKTDGGDAAGGDDKKPEKPAPNPSSSSTDDEEPTAEEGGIGFQKILMIVAGVLLVVTLLAKVLVKPADDLDGE